MRLTGREILVVVSARTRKEIRLGQFSVRQAGGIRRREQARAAGRCVTCWASTENGYARCVACLAKFVKYHVAWRKKPIKPGYCYECHWREAAPGRAKCEHCQNLSNAGVRRLHLRRKRAGLCGRCSEPVITFGTCLKCRAISAAQNRARRLRLKG